MAARKSTGAARHRARSNQVRTHPRKKAGKPQCKPGPRSAPRPDQRAHPGILAEVHADLLDATETVGVVLAVLQVIVDALANHDSPDSEALGVTLLEAAVYPPMGAAEFLNEFRKDQT